MLQIDPKALVRCAFLELSEPNLTTAVTELVNLGASSVTIVPMFLGVGKHVREDLPLLVANLQNENSGTSFHLQPSVGEDRRVIELLAQIALPFI